MPAREAVGRLVDRPGGPVHVREDGPAGGPTVLLLHGFASSLHSFDRVVEALATDCRVVRVDLLGHGCSARSGAGYDSEAQAAMVSGVLAQLGGGDGGREGGPVTVVGHSFGADVAIAVAERSPAVHSVVVIGQAPDYSSARLPAGSWLLRGPVRGRVLHRLAPERAVVRSARFAFAPGVRAVDLFDRPSRIVEDFRATDPATYRTILVDRPALLARRGLDQRLRDLGRPALVVLGALDQLYPVGPTRARYAALPGVRVEVLPGSGHSPPLEEPAATARLIRAALE